MGDGGQPTCRRRPGRTSNLAALAQIEIKIRPLVASIYATKERIVINVGLITETAGHFYANNYARQFAGDLEQASRHIGNRGRTKLRL